MTTISAKIGNDHYHTTISSAFNTIHADEPVSNGGNDSGFSPSELLCSALGACTCITLRMYADRKKWALDVIYVAINFQRDAKENVTHIDRQITLSGNLSTEEKDRLLQIANQCPIHKVLSNPIHIHTALS
jgi:putative redox protein